MRDIRVLIADDSSLARAMIADVLRADSGLCIVGEAEHGQEALDLTMKLRPDIITMDLNMPGMNGFDAIKNIMNRCPTPILVITSQSDGEAGFRAVSLGALEVIDKALINDDSINGLLYMIKFLSKVKVIRHIQDSRAGRIELSPPDTSGQGWMVGIAASTGGPKALSLLLSSLPPQFSVPVLIAQHIGGEFAPGLVSFLKSSTSLQVKLASDDEPVMDSHVYIAPSGMHLTVTKKRRISLVARQSNDVHVPSCDRLFTSLAYCCKEQAMGIVLTGMGSDGTAGAAAIASRGGYVITQDEGTSAVFGMPKAVFESGYVNRVVPLGEISRVITDRINGWRR